MFFKLLLTALVVSFCSCQQAQVNVEYNTEVDFFKYKTFGWLNVSDQKGKNYTSLKEQKIGSVVRNVLAERGLHFSSEKPDVLVAVNIVEKEKVHYTPRFGHHYHRRWGYYSRWDYYEPDYYLESTVIIALVETGSKKALWEGSILDWSYEGASQEDTEKMIRALLENYPPTDSETYSPIP